MRCLKCNKLSFRVICSDCEKLFLIPISSKREVGNLEVISIFNFYTVKDFIESKYYISGYRIYKFLAKNYLKPILNEYDKYVENEVYLIGVDESIKRDYSLISLLLHYSSKNLKNIKPLYNVLKAKNHISYAGKPLEFRLKNPREFKYYGPKNINAILIDDIITTGTTLQEAYTVLSKSNVKIEFALTLANVDKG